MKTRDNSLHRFNLAIVTLWLLASFSIALVFSSAQAREPKEIVIGVEDIAYLPYFDYTDSKSSLSKVILDKFAVDNGYSITYLPLPIKQFSKWLYENDIDFKYPDNKRWHGELNEKHSAEYFSNDIFYLRAGTVVLQENVNRPKVFFKSLGLITGFDPTLWKAEIARKEIDVLTDNSTKVLVKHLASGLLDGIDVDINVANYYRASLGINKQITYSDTLPQEVFSHQLSTIKYPNTIKQFNSWLEKNREFITRTQTQFNIPIERPTK